MWVKILSGNQRGLVLEMPQVNAEHAIQTNFAELYKAPADDVSRCAICGWPLAASADEGCVRGNCSLRPAALNLYAPARAVAESCVVGNSVAPAQGEKETATELPMAEAVPAPQTTEMPVEAGAPADATAGEPAGQ